MKIYIAGKITGDPYNKAKFARAAAALGVSVEQLCEVVALGKAGRLMVLPEEGSDGQ